MEKVKSLATELGLIEKIIVDSSRRGSSTVDPSKGDQLFDYLVVIDFESTCWDGSVKNQPWQHLPEIIEFPAVLLNVTTGEIEDEFHQYVMPVENPKLSEFCMKLTGIKQQQVDDGVPLATCMVLFTHWITKISEDDRKLTFHVQSPSSKSCTFVTWSDWDLAVCLQNETQRKQIRKPDILSQWIDLRASYRMFYNRQPQGLRGAMAELGIPFAGREHSGIVDARNTALLTHRMATDGFQLKITGSLENPPSKITRMTGASGVSSTKPRSLRQPLKTINKMCHGKGAQIKSSGPLHPVQKNLNVQPNTPLSTKFKHFVRKRKDSAKSPQTSPICTIRAKYTIPTVLKTPNISKQSTRTSSCKRTPPLCGCGRRAVSKVVNSPGPNQGRLFFSCSKNRRSLGLVAQVGCKFFRWC